MLHIPNRNLRRTHTVILEDMSVIIILRVPSLVVVPSQLDWNPLRVMVAVMRLPVFLLLLLMKHTQWTFERNKQFSD